MRERVNLRLHPDLVQKMKDRAEEMGAYLNACYETAIEAWIEGRPTMMIGDLPPSQQQTVMTLIDAMRKKRNPVILDAIETFIKDAL